MAVYSRVHVLNCSGSIPGLLWENNEKTIFRMPWKHAGRQDYNLEEDSKIFMVRKSLLFELRRVMEELGRVRKG